MSRSSFLLALACAWALALPPLVTAQTLRGSRASVERMYRQAVDHELHFHETTGGVRKAANGGSLVRLTETADYRLVDVSHAYVLPATRTFIQRLSAQYRATCGEPLVVTSLVRPRSQRLANSTERSVHPTGMAVDLRKPARARCLSWLRETLLHLENRGMIEAIEEHRPPHFHVAVFPDPYTRYVGSGGGARTTVAAVAPIRPSAAPAPKAGPASSDQQYRVRPGDSIWSIARRSRLTVDQLKTANNLQSSRIDAGQLLVIPSR